MFSNLDNFGFDEQAVSPVVGVILMVAITVILAAVIGTFVLDLGGQVQQNAQAGVSFDDDGTDVTVQLNSVQSADAIYVTSDAGNPTDGVSETGTEASPGTGNYLLNSNDAGGVGTTATVTAPADGDQITVIGVLDGQENVLQTYTYDA